MDTFAPTPISKVRRHPERAAYDRAALYAILDAGLVCHVGYAIGGQPVVTPTIHWREGDRLYWHGSAASRMLETLAAGAKTCVTVSIIDGLVLARSAFTHSMNYRSAMVFGTARLVEGRDAKLKALEHLIERLYPGRWATLRAPLEKEIKATSVISMAIEEASAKVRAGPPLDYDYDMGERVWAGVIPLALVPGAPRADPKLDPMIAMPPMLARYALPRGQGKPSS
jgi:nitroimidazol reductase NimA-like FMN-containing flavoprotein (pyridoxamine 5'-phosphate oxidase superfamily)